MDAWAWLVLFGLGVFHGLNPAMGWLFAVALGLHRHSRRLVGLAVVPLALGHAASVAVVLAVLLTAGIFIHVPVLQSLAGSVLVAWGAYHFARGYRHRFRVGMTTGLAGLALWSFLMASAHGAGLMLAPVLMDEVHGHSHHGQASSLAVTLPVLLAAGAVHTAAMAVTTAILALVVYEWVGLAVLRRAWFNLDRLWAGALIVAGVVVLLMW